MKEEKGNGQGQCCNQGHETEVCTVQKAKIGMCHISIAIEAYEMEVHTD